MVEAIVISSRFGLDEMTMDRGAKSVHASRGVGTRGGGIVTEWRPDEGDAS